MLGILDILHEHSFSFVWSCFPLEKNTYKFFKNQEKKKNYYPNFLRILKKCFQKIIKSVDILNSE